MVGELPVDGFAGDEGAVVDRPEKLVEIRWHVGAGRVVTTELSAAFAVSSVTATVVNTVPAKLVGMAAATTSMVRDFGFALGGYSTGFLVVAIAALACAVATALFLGAGPSRRRKSP